MKVKYIGSNAIDSILREKEYEVLSIENSYYRIIDENGRNSDTDGRPGHFYEPIYFDIVSGEPGEYVDEDIGERMIVTNRACAIDCNLFAFPLEYFTAQTAEEIGIKEEE